MKNLQANPLVNIKMTDTTNTFGFEALYKIYCKEINKKQDVIILLIHWYLTKCGFRCIGIGDEVSPDLNFLRYTVSRFAIISKFYISYIFPS